MHVDIQTDQNQIFRVVELLAQLSRLTLLEQAVGAPLRDGFDQHNVASKSLIVNVLPVRTSVIGVLNQSGVVEGAGASALVVGNAGEVGEPQADRSWLVNRSTTKAAWKKGLGCMAFSSWTKCLPPKGLVIGLTTRYG